MKRNLTIALLAAAVFAGGCGGDDDGPSQIGADPADVSDGDSSEQGSSGDGPAGARLVLDGEEYLMPAKRVCVAIAGSFGAQFATDDNENTVYIDVPPPGAEDGSGEWDPPGVRFDLGDEEQWVMGADEPNNDNGVGVHSSLDSIERGDNSITVTGTFVERYSLFDPNGEPETVQGSLEVSCPD